MESTGVFSNEMNDYFAAEKGAYTAFTNVEIDKGTFNVKSVIKNLLIEKIGRANIPVVNVTPNQTITFTICDKAKIYGKSKLDIPCKFSKKDKDEMTIYFNVEVMKLFNAEPGDYWYIYFVSGSNQPVLGIFSKDKWENLFDKEDMEEIQEPDEADDKELNYSVSVSGMIISEEAAPIKSAVRLSSGTKTVKSLSADEAAIREKNKKKKGNRGEEIAIEIEKRRLSSLGRADLISKIAHVAKYKDGLGYDLISTDVGKDGKEVEIYIEVKTTSGDKDMPFFVSARELEVSQKYRELYYVYRIYDMKEKSNEAKFYRISGALDLNFELTPTEFRANR